MSRTPNTTGTTMTTGENAGDGGDDDKEVRQCREASAEGAAEGASAGVGLWTKAGLVLYPAGGARNKQISICAKNAAPRGAPRPRPGLSAFQVAEPAINLRRSRTIFWKQERDVSAGIASACLGHVSARGSPAGVRRAVHGCAKGHQCDWEGACVRNRCTFCLLV